MACVRKGWERKRRGAAVGRGGVIGQWEGEVRLVGSCREPVGQRSFETAIVSSARSLTHLPVCVIPRHTLAALPQHSRATDRAIKVAIKVAIKAKPKK